MSHTFYYSLKPLIPRALRMWLRRWRAQKILKTCGDIWPINEAAGKQPENWPGWPDGKQFALVLTHDVESQKGLDQVRQLAELEMELGFRSCFNFIPEGEYSVPSELREWLVENGFEVGVHDLHHDGHLYSSRRRFRKKAKRINQYLKEWGAVGFRSGFMLHKFDWLHDLNIQYDSSTFDTDPFEPQPDGVNTIFPIRMERAIVNSESLHKGNKNDPQSAIRNPQSHNQSAYIELPYTLPQDSTLFLILGDAGPEIWKRKLDWIAECGGLALVNVHPDYLQFEGKAKKGKTFPVAFYREFLEYILSFRDEDYWHPQARDLADWYQRTSNYQIESEANLKNSTLSCTADTRDFFSETKPLCGKRGAVLLYSHFPSDPRPRRAALAMVDAGMKVDFFCLQDGDDQLKQETVDGINIFRLSMKKRRQDKVTYVCQYTFFLVCCFFCMIRHSFRGGRYDVVHVHNMPDVLVFSALIPKIYGAKVILDLHDPMPELMCCIYELTKDHRMVRILTRFESWSIRFANLVLTPNESFRKRFIERGCPSEKIKIVMNSPQESVFDPKLYPAAAPLGSDPEAFRIMHHGFLAARHGVDIALRAVALLQDAIPGLEFHIYGGYTPYMDELKELVEELKLPGGVVQFHGHQPHPVIAKAILSCDLGLIPNRRSAFTEINMPTRIFEYVAMGRPVIVPDTRGIRDYFNDESALFFEPDDPKKLAAAILDVHQNPGKTIPIGDFARKVYEQHRWESEREVFLSEVQDLIRS